MSRLRVLLILVLCGTAVLLVVGLVTLPGGLVPNFLHSGPGRLSAIRATLEQIDGAKLLFATNYHVSPDTVLTREQLQEYLKPGFWRGESSLGVQFRINSIETPAEAIVTKRYDTPRGASLRPGGIVRWSTNVGGYEVVQPSNASQRK